MIRALVLISVSFLVFLTPGAASQLDFLDKSKGKNYGLRADFCSDKDAATCHSFFLQNTSNAIVEKTTIRVRNTRKDDGGNVVCKRGKDDVVRTNLSSFDRFRARLDTRCTYYVRFRLGTCDGNNDMTFHPGELKDALNTYKDPTIVLAGKCDVYVKFDEVKT